MAASATFALRAGVWFRRGRLLIVSPDSLGTACPLSGRNSTYRPVQISGTGSAFAAYLAPLRNSEWVVYSKRPFGGPEQVLRYLARYTHRVAISMRIIETFLRGQQPKHR